MTELTQAIKPKIKQKDEIPNLKDTPFTFAPTASEELKMLLYIAVPTLIHIIFDLIPPWLAIVFVGHIRNDDSAVLLAAVVLAHNYVALTGSGFGMGLHSALYTLIPQSIGADRFDLLRNYTQRAFLILTFGLLISVVLQIYSGNITCYVLRYKNDEPICYHIQMYCICLIPWMFLWVWSQCLFRLFQNLNYNFELLIIVVVTNILAPLWNYLFVFYFEIGYLGTAITMAVVRFCTAICCILFLCYKGYKYIFIPSPLRIMLRWTKVKEFLALTIPGFVDLCGGWWIAELCGVLSGFVVNPSVSISALVVAYSILGVCIQIPATFGTAITVRVGKFIGAGSMKGAKRACVVAGVVVTFITLCVGILLLALRHKIAVLFTYNQEITKLVSDLIYWVFLAFIGYTTFRSMLGVFMGLGKLLIPAVVAFTVQDFIAFPMCIILLFVIGWKDYMFLGVFTIIGTFAGGYIATAVVVVLIFIIKNETIWKEGVSESQSRIPRRINIDKDRQNSENTAILQENISYGGINKNDSQSFVIN